MTNGLYPGTPSALTHFANRIDPTAASISAPTDWVGIAEAQIYAGEACQLTDSGLFRPLSPWLKTVSTGDLQVSTNVTSFSASAYSTQSLSSSISHIIETDDFHVITLLTNSAATGVVLNRKALTAGTSDWPSTFEFQVPGVAVGSGIYKAGGGRFWLVTTGSSARLYDDRMNLIGGPHVVSATAPNLFLIDTSGGADLVMFARSPGAANGWFMVRMNQSGTIVWQTPAQDASVTGTVTSLHGLLRLANGDYVVKYHGTSPSNATKICRVSSSGSVGSIVTVASTTMTVGGGYGPVSPHLTELSNGNIVVPFFGAGGATDIAIYDPSLSLVTTIDLGTNLTPATTLPAVIAWDGMFTVAYANGTALMVRTYTNSGELLQLETTISSFFPTTATAQYRIQCFRIGNMGVLVESGIGAGGTYCVAGTFQPWGLVNFPNTIYSDHMTLSHAHKQAILTRSGNVIIHTNGGPAVIGSTSTPNIVGVRPNRGSPFGVARHDAAPGERVVMATVGHFQLPRYQWASGIGFPFDMRNSSTTLWGNKGSWTGSTLILNGLTSYSNQ